MKLLYTISAAFALLLTAMQSAASDIVTDSLGFDKGAAVSPEDLLRGKVSGVRVTGETGNPLERKDLTIRGIGSVRGLTRPLYIIDGTMLESSSCDLFDPFWKTEGETDAAEHNTLFHLSAYDIETIEVLKDVSATAIYGARGANGVIIINTRKSGIASPSVDWHSNLGINAASGLKASVQHNHHIRVSGSGNTTSYNVSANFRNIAGVTPNTAGNYFGLKTNFETHANKYIWFGANLLLGMGRASDTAGSCGFGQDSYTAALQDVPCATSAQAWTADYDDKSRDYAGTLSAFLTVNFTPWLYWKTTAGGDFRSLNRSFWYGEQTAFGAAQNGAASLNTSRILAWNVNTSLNLNRYIAADHHIRASVGFESFGDSDSYNTIEGEDFFSKDLRADGLKLMNSAQYTHKFFYTYSHIGISGALSYDYKQALGVSLSVRADKSRMFEDGFVLYPSASGYIDIAKLTAPSSRVLGSLRVEGGYGEAGMEKMLPNLAVSVVAQPYCYDLERLRTREWNAGIRAVLFDGRLGLGVKYYDRTSDDSILNFCFGTRGVNYWYRSERSLLSSSATKTGNRGFEADVRGDIVRTGDWRWTVSANGAWNVNQILSHDYSDVGIAGVGALANLPGRSIGSIIGYSLDADGLYVDANGDGLITPADCSILGRSLPKFMGAIGTTLRWRTLTFDLLFDGEYGADRVNLTRLAAEGLSRVTGRYVCPADYIRLSRLSLRYDIPVKAKWLKGLGVTASGHNLLCLTKYSGWNPDVRALDYASYPFVRTFVLGLEVEF